MSRILTAALLLTSLWPSFVQRAPDSPEPAILALVRSMYANDVETYNRLTIPDPRRARLTTGGRVNTAALQRLEQDPGSLQMKSRRPFLYRGREAYPEASGNYPVGTTALYSVAKAATRWSRLSYGRPMDGKWMCAGGSR